MKTKISIIGAGSAVFSLNLIRDICLTPNLEGSTISFMDIDEQRLQGVYQLCQRYADEAGISLNLEATTDRRESLQGANFVINAALVGGHQPLQEGWKIAQNHGYRFGGSLHIVHDEAFWVNFYQLDLMESILQDILEICPNAWYMLVANPVMAGVTYLKRKYPTANIAGFCHGYNGVYHVSKVLGLEPEHITFEVPGVNHFIWLTQFRYKGENAFPYLDRWMEEESEEYFKTCGYCDPMGPKAIDLYRRFGAFPIGDTGNPGGGSWGYWYHTNKETEWKWKEDPTTWYKNHFRYGEEEVAKIKRVSEDASQRVMDTYPAQHSRETMVPFMEAIACDIPRVLILNILNDAGYVPGIPLDFQVEIPTYVSAIGVQGIKTNGLPRNLIPFALRDRVAPVETEILAFEHGRYEDLLHLVKMDPWTSSEEQAQNLIQDIFNMPGMEKLRDHFKK